MEFTEDILEIHERFKAAGKELFLVGGCVRDMLLGDEVTDFDFATDASALEISTILDGYSFELQGAHFGVMRVFTKTGSYEIASYREDVTFGRKPTVKLGVTMKEDARRRDFTINAMYYDIEKREVIDLVNGLYDLADKIIRTTGPAGLIFDQDRLRILRAVRFKNKIGGSYHPSIIEAIERNNEMVGLNASGEMEPIHQNRIVEEFLKGIKQAASVSDYIADMKKFGLLGQVFHNNYSWGPSVESKCPEIVIARLLVVQTALPRKDLTKMVERLVEECNFSTKLARGVMFLLEAQNVNEGTAFQLERSRIRSNVTKDNLREFAEHLRSIGDTKNYANISTFADYEIITDGAELLKAGFSGAALGQEQLRLEREHFLKLKDGRTVKG